MRTMLAAVASACLMCVTVQASAMDEMKKDGMTKEQMMKHDEMTKMCSNKTGMAKDDMAKCDAMMKHDSTTKKDDGTMKK